MNRQVTRVIAVGAVALLSATACGSRPTPTTSITVYAASSLIKSFTAIGKLFEAANPRYTVEFVFANSVDLANSLADGADADVFASGDRENMDVVADAGAVSGTPVPFAANRLVVVTPAGNPRHLTSFADLAQPGLRVALCGARSACGSATQLAEERAGVHLRPQGTEPTPNLVLKDVTSGKADAGVAFMTDGLGAGDTASWFALSGDDATVTAWLTVLKGADQDREASQFVAEVTSDAGRRILSDNGFYQPASGPTG
ncbi:MAG: molybdate transport system substrate-binding protein [Mycobacterium sp.]|jgi:molybdate transport system substrate-binding protein|nr:molybdate transport system substrate-binding protein [Mycobacterium sp.]